MRILAIRYAKQIIRMNAVPPGTASTPLVTTLLEDPVKQARISGADPDETSRGCSRDLEFDRLLILEMDVVDTPPILAEHPRHIEACLGDLTDMEAYSNPVVARGEHALHDVRVAINSAAAMIMNRELDVVFLD